MPDIARLRTTPQREARAIIAEATRFEIEVVGVPKPSTLLKKPKKGGGTRIAQVESHTLNGACGF